MATNISYDGPNSGLQIGQNHGSITAHFLQSEVSLNQACLRDLRTTSPHDDKGRIERTNGGLLVDSYRWILDNEQFRQWRDSRSSRLLWIKGDPGKGKTMLLCGIINELTQTIGDNGNIAFFFCQATDVRINNATAVLRGLIYSLVVKQASLLSHVRSRYDQAGKTLFEDVNAWNALSDIFHNILKDPTLQNTCLVIDALDECTTDLPLLMDLIVQESSTYSHVKWIVSSRNWPGIEERLNMATQTAPISLELNEISVSNAVEQFIRHKVHHLAEVKKYGGELRDTVHRHLSSNSQSTFLWVALVCQDLNRTSRRHVLKKLKGFPPGLDALYSRMIDQVRISEDAEVCKRILAVMSIAYRPITLGELTTIVEIPDDISDDDVALLEIIAVCGSFLACRGDVIIFVHQSAKEFLLEKARIELFPGDREAEHFAIFSRSLESMFKTLQHNILDIKPVRSSNEELTRSRLNSVEAVQYACVYWVDHLLEGWCSEDNYHILDDRSCLDKFLRQKYLHWLESLGILGCIPEGITAMLKLEDLLHRNGLSKDLLDRVQDACRFIRYYRHAIENRPLQVYSSGLVFSPTQSTTRICYQKEKPDWILNSPVVDERWSLCLQTLEGHSNWVNSIAWSPDGSRLASASSDKTVRIWDPATGQCAFTLEGHSDLVNKIDWSPDGSRLASASPDKTIRIWNPATGKCAFTLEGHSDRLNSIAWSPDGSRLASASSDRTVRIWDSATGQCAFTLEGHSDRLDSIAWSPDGSRLASASSDKTVRIWDPVTSQCTFTLEGHGTNSGLIAWSPDGRRLASASSDKTVRIWDPATGQCVSTLEGHSSYINSIAWSPDGNRLASASSDKTVRIWDPATGQCVSTFEGHWASSIAWSADGNRLASASNDMTVSIWDPATGQCASNLIGHSGWVNSIAWSANGGQLASASNDKTVRIWDPATGQGASTPSDHSNSVISIAWSPDGSRLASVSDDKSVKIWDQATGQCASTLIGHSSWVISTAWSPDGGQLASTSGDNTVRIWDIATGKCVFTLIGHSSWVISTAWSPDGGQLASASGDNTVRIWDLATGQCTSTLEGHSDAVTSIAWSLDGSRLASASDDRTVRIWISAIGQCESIIKGHIYRVRSITWSPDGRRLASADDKTVTIWDLVRGRHDLIRHIPEPGFLQFDKMRPSYLHTNVGTFDIGPSDTIASSPHCSSLRGISGYGLSSDYSWITYNGSNLLWLPAEYRPPHPSLFATYANLVAIACSSGHVIFLALSEQSLLSSA